MKIRIVTELQDHLNGETAWRRKELHNHLTLTREARPYLKQLLLRTGVCLVYAHWEGFSKNAAAAYLDFVNHQGHRVRDLSDHLIAACMRGEIRKCGEAKKPTIHTSLVSRLRGGLPENAELTGIGLVDTESNLNSKVLRELTHLIGVDYGPFETKAPLLDEKLLKNRNAIAHGEFLEVDERDYELLHVEIIGMMVELGERILNAAMLKSYLAPVSVTAHAAGHRAPD